MKKIPLFLLIFCLALTACAAEQTAPATDIPLPAPTNTPENIPIPTVAPVQPLIVNDPPSSDAGTGQAASVPATPVADLFRIFLGLSGKPEVDAKNAVTPVNGVATLAWAEGKHDFYACVTDGSFINYLADLVISNADFTKTLQPTQSNITVGDLTCNMYRNVNPFNYAFDNNVNLATGTPTATSLLTVALNFQANAPAGGGGGDGGGTGTGSSDGGGSTDGGGTGGPGGGGDGGGNNGG